MRRLALLICLLLFVAVAYGGNGYTQSQRRPRHVKPAPTPRPTEEPDSLEGLPPLKPTPTPKSDDNVLDLLPDETPTPTDDFFADIPDAKPAPLPEWTFILLQKGKIYSYSPRRLSHPTLSIVRVWLKIRHFGEAREEAIQNLGRSGYDYANFDYTLQHEEYDCGRSRRRMLSWHDYDRAGSIIRSKEYDNDGQPEWGDIVPESVGETILEVVCRHKK